MRLLVQQGSLFRYLANIVLTERDGSIVLTFPRDGTTVRSKWSVSPILGVSEKVSEEADVAKGMKMTIHASGRVNFDGRHPPIYVEPIWKLGEVSSLLIYRLPGLDVLDIFTSPPGPTDVVLKVESLHGPVSFEILLAPAEVQSPQQFEPAIVLTYLGSLHLVFRLLDVEEIIPEEISDQLVTLYPPQGTRDSQEIGEDEALIQFSRNLFPDNELMLDGPNREGWYRLIFPVQMRIAPAPTITALDPSITVEIKSQELDPRTNRVQIRFRFRDKGGVRKAPTPISSIELNAEF